MLALKGRSATSSALDARRLDASRRVRKRALLLSCSLHLQRGRWRPTLAGANQSRVPPFPPVPMPGCVQASGADCAPLLNAGSLPFPGFVLFRRAVTRRTFYSLVEITRERAYPDPFVRAW